MHIILINGRELRIFLVLTNVDSSIFIMNIHISTFHRVYVQWVITQFHIRINETASVLLDISKNGVIYLKENKSYLSYIHLTNRLLIILINLNKIDWNS